MSHHTIPPVPRNNTVLKGLKQTIEYIWDNWFQVVASAIASTPQEIGEVDLTAQSTSLSSTALVTPALPGGAYRVSYYARITRAASVSSSLTPQIAWTDGGVACSYTGAAMTGNTTSTTQSGVIALVADANTTINYLTTYASAGGTSMQYSLVVRAEELP